MMRHADAGHRLLRLAQRGPVVRYRPSPEPAFLVSDPSAVQRVLLSNSRNYSKDTIANALFRESAGDGVLTLEGDEWLSERRLITDGLHRLMVGEAAGVIREEVAACEGRIAAYATGERGLLDLGQEMSRFTMAVTGRLLFGSRVEFAVLDEMIAEARALFRSAPRTARLRDLARSFADRIIEGRLRRGHGDGFDLLQLMLDAERTDDDRRKVRAEVVNLMLAGFETTASHLTWTWVLLSANRDEYAGLRSSVADSTSPVGDPSPTTAVGSYLDGVVKESLRLYPPAWVIGRRSRGPDLLAGVPIPAGAVLAVSPYLMHRSPDLWVEPERFHPARWRSGAGGSAPVVALASYLPFGLGPRQCLGRELATYEALFLLESLSRSFTFTVRNPSQIRASFGFVLRPTTSVEAEVRFN